MSQLVGQFMTSNATNPFVPTKKGYILLRIDFNATFLLRAGGTINFQTYCEPLKNLLSAIQEIGSAYRGRLFACQHRPHMTNRTQDLIASYGPMTTTCFRNCRSISEVNSKMMIIVKKRPCSSCCQITRLTCKTVKYKSLQFCI